MDTISKKYACRWCFRILRGRTGHCSSGPYQKGRQEHTGRKRKNRVKGIAVSFFSYLHHHITSCMKRKWIWFIPGIIAGFLIFSAGSVIVTRTSENDYCESCHIHPHATASWKQSVHYVTKSGIRTNCVDCHLPPHGEGYLVEKVKTGARDIWGKWTKDSVELNWEEKSQVEHARKHVYESSCIACHKNLFPPELTREGSEAHIYYTNFREKQPDLQCINCHLNAGHYIEGYVHGDNTGC